MDFKEYGLKELDECFSWTKQITERKWKNYSTLTVEQYKRAGVGGADWQRGTKWSGGFSKEEIEQAEKTWGLLFPPDYRQFLSTLGAPDTPRFSMKWKGKEMVPGTSPSFYDWRHNQEDIAGALEWPLKGLLFDVEHEIWCIHWGDKPKTEERRKQRIVNLVTQAPPLIPIIGHRYLLGVPADREGNPVLSVYQSDIIVCGMDFKRFLLVELASLLNINHDSAYRYANSDYDEDEIRKIPFWGPIICGDC